MAVKIHEIKEYKYSFNGDTGGPGRLSLWNDLGQVAEVRFIEDNTPVPRPIISEDLNSVTFFIRSGFLLSLVDMLRNEKPVSLTISKQGKGFVSVHTGREPVGEGET